MCRASRKVAREATRTRKVVKEKARARARVELKPLKLPQPPRKTIWTSLVMIPTLTPLPPP